MPLHVVLASRSMPGSSILAFRSRFHGLSSTQSDDTVPSLASASATAIGLMIASLAITSIAKFVVIVIIEYLNIRSTSSW